MKAPLAFPSNLLEDIYMMNDISFLESLALTLQVLGKIIGNFSPVIVPGIALVATVSFLSRK